MDPEMVLGSSFIGGTQIAMNRGDMACCTKSQQRPGAISKSCQEHNTEPKMDDLSPEKLAKWKEICSPEEIKRFKEINANGDLYLEPSEIIEAARKDRRLMDEKKAERWIKSLDTDKDGKVSFEEFLKAYAELED
ncbi:hypothetical protein BDV34DRAFT_222601 [Aspergillus parasiticus]|uniref:EF-hand domain-containing protein n=1 Tax=Aspergillus parasiticus TaxID=5067 RepID=A0A5N6DU57_ASPPA|nr:hypothetical protein BDV34DRAFT_222601 [Aspergillus parasiticus]